MEELTHVAGAGRARMVDVGDKHRTRRRALAEGRVRFGEDAFLRLNVDAIAFADLAGRGRAEEVLVKNRYRDLWALDREFNVLWTRQLSTGHFPAPFDLDGDGRDEIVVGGTALRPDGSTLFEVDLRDDHVDEIVIGRLGGPGAPMQVAVVAGSEGFMVWDLDGRILHRARLGHAQRLSAAPYREDLDGAQLFTTTYWGEPGIVSFHDAGGRRLWFREIPETGQVVCPVDWTGRCRPLCLLSGSARHGGMIDAFVPPYVGEMLNRKYRLNNPKG